MALPFLISGNVTELLPKDRIGPCGGPSVGRPLPCDLLDVKSSAPGLRRRQEQPHASPFTLQARFSPNHLSMILAARWLISKSELGQGDWRLEAGGGRLKVRCDGGLADWIANVLSREPSRAGRRLVLGSFPQPL